MKVKALAAAAALTAAYFAPATQAAIDCGNASVNCQSVSLNGVTVTYDANQLNAGALYDAPVLSDDGNGNVIVDLRATSNFFADADSGNPSDQTLGSALLDITVDQLTGQAVEELFIFEGGNYVTSGGGTVAQSGELKVTDNNSGVTNAGTGGSDTYAAGSFSGSGDWSVLGNTLIYTSQGGFPPSKQAGTSDDISVEINNILSANANGGTAFIRKSTSNGFVRLGINTSPPAPTVPVPAAAWLFGSALLGLFARKRMAQ